MTFHFCINELHIQINTCNYAINSFLTVIDAYCDKHPEYEVDFSEQAGDFSQHINAYARLRCKNGYKSSETQPFKAVCSKKGPTTGEWVASATCTCIQYNCCSFLSFPAMIETFAKYS